MHSFLEPKINMASSAPPSGLSESEPYRYCSFPPPSYHSEEGEEAQEIVPRSSNNGAQRAPEADGNSADWKIDCLCGDPCVTFMVLVTLATLIFLFTLVIIGTENPTILCRHAPDLVDYINALPTAVVMNLPGLVLSFAIATISDGKRSLRGFFSPARRRIALIFFIWSISLLVGAWAYQLKFEWIECEAPGLG